MKMHPIAVAAVRGFSRFHMKISRAFGVQGFGAFRNTLILTTRGRKTGKEIPTPLLYIEQDGKLYVVASFGGNDVAPGWYKNLLANPEVSVELDKRTSKYRARSLATEEAAKVWPKLLELYPTYASYQKNTTRVIPVVELTRA